MQRTVLVTGCSDGGIGSTLARVFQDRGLHVFATARNPDKMSQLKDLPNVTLLKLDVTSSADIQATVEVVDQKTGGTLDYLINNAAQGRFVPVIDEDLAQVKELFGVNVFAPLALTKAFVPLLIKAKGMVVYITSIGGYVHTPYLGTYSASKRAIEQIAGIMRLELQPFEVDVLSVVTGAVKSNGYSYYDDYALPKESLYKPIEDIIASRAQGNDGMTRMDTTEYADAVVDAVLKRTTGKFWYGSYADSVRMSTTATTVLQDAMDAGAVLGSGLEKLPG